MERYGAFGYCKGRFRRCPQGCDDGRMTPLLSCVAAWRAHDVDAIVATVAEDCQITECYGPVYLGRDRVEQWAKAWFGAGGMVNGWSVTERFVAGDREVTLVTAPSKLSPAIATIRP